jgi:hypothetical protein
VKLGFHSYDRLWCHSAAPAVDCYFAHRHIPVELLPRVVTKPLQPLCERGQHSGDVVVKPGELCMRSNRAEAELSDGLSQAAGSISRALPML